MRRDGPIDQLLQSAAECLGFKAQAAAMTSTEGMRRGVPLIKIMKQLAFTVGFVAAFAGLLMYVSIRLAYRNDLFGPYPHDGVTETVFGGIFFIGAGLVIWSALP